MKNSMWCQTLGMVLRWNLVFFRLTMTLCLKTCKQNNITFIKVCPCRNLFWDRSTASQHAKNYQVISCFPLKMYGFWPSGWVILARTQYEATICLIIICKWHFNWNLWTYGQNTMERWSPLHDFFFIQLFPLDRGLWLALIPEFVNSSWIGFKLSFLNCVGEME